MELDESKYITLERSVEDLVQNTKTTISQFSANYGGYLMILVNEIMYFFEYDGTIINKADLSGSINSTYYTLAPYFFPNIQLFKKNFIFIFIISFRPYYF